MIVNLKDLYYDYCLDKKTTVTQAQAIAFEILADVTDRRGWRQEWDGFGQDIQEEIIKTWIEKIQGEL